MLDVGSVTLSELVEVPFFSLRKVIEFLMGEISFKSFIAESKFFMKAGLGYWVVEVCRERIGY